MMITLTTSTTLKNHPSMYSFILSVMMKRVIQREVFEVGNQEQ